MKKIFEGRSINLIRESGGIVAGDKKQFDLWTQGGIITITEFKQVEAINKAIKEAKHKNLDVKDYLLYMINEENILN